MARPRKIRFIQEGAPVHYYKPRGIPMVDLVETVLPLDALEALRLADVEGLEQIEAAQSMGVSRSTFSRLVLEARRAVATALVRDGRSGSKAARSRCSGRVSPGVSRARCGQAAGADEGKPRHDRRDRRWQRRHGQDLCNGCIRIGRSAKITI